MNLNEDCVALWPQLEIGKALEPWDNNLLVDTFGASKNIRRIQRIVNIWYEKLPGISTDDWLMYRRNNDYFLTKIASKENANRLICGA